MCIGFYIIFIIFAPHQTLITTGRAVAEVLPTNGTPYSRVGTKGGTTQVTAKKEPFEGGRERQP